MKHLKTFESEIKYKIGDPVICTESSETNNNLLNYFFSKNLGTYIGLHEERDDVGKVIFEDIPSDIYSYFNDSNFRYFRTGDIRKATPEEIEKFKIEKQAKKYNI